MLRVIFIHWGESFYLRYSLEQAKKYGDVILLKDVPTNNSSLEIARWFILRDYLVQNKVSRCLYLDSDVLLYKNPENDFLNCDLAISKYHCGHTAFINRIDVLIDFCDYIQQNMENPDLVSNTRTYVPDGIFPDTVGDMVLLNNFVLENNYNIMDTSKIVDNSVYDHNINLSDGFEVSNGIKKIVFVNNIPFGNLGGRNIRFNSLHFQGSHRKQLMKDYTGV